MELGKGKDQPLPLFYEIVRYFFFEYKMILFRPPPRGSGAERDARVRDAEGRVSYRGEKEPFFRPLHSQLIAKPSMLNKAQPYGARKKEGKRLLPSGHLLRPNSPTLAYRTTSMHEVGGREEIQFGLVHRHMR
ncbi:unnamed protein product [Dovyalis caffra]|uniref:Uncharacterized protein n=1 Tax=Dovyalis caffra TaxID=77055 RepID=A0AAV1R473_9ROSI|nr:unnamed protein product [Dovyalis caffra]